LFSLFQVSFFFVMKSVICVLSMMILAASAATAPLSLGSLTSISQINCPTGFANGAVCRKATVTGCSGTANISFRFGVLQPAGAVLGTAIVHGGGGGTATFDNGYVAILSAAGLRVVQIAWQSDWENTGQAVKNIKLAACRPATFVDWCYGNVNCHDEGNLLGFSYYGHSGGSAVGAYLLSWYGLGTKLDAVMVSAGPVFGDIKEGCKNPSGANVLICPNGQLGCTQQAEQFSHTPAYGGASSCASASAPSGMGTWTGYDCGPGCPANAAAELAWKDMSVVSPGASYNFPTTALSQWFCKEPTNNSGAQGQYWASQFTSSGQTALYNEKLVSGCSSAEGIWTGTVGGVNARTVSAQWLTTTPSRAIKEKKLSRVVFLSFLSVHASLSFIVLHLPFHPFH
jgi:hypothetical protein